MDRAARSARAPGNVAPVTDDGDDQNEHGDEDDAGGFGAQDSRVAFSCFGSLAWGRRRHQDIVAPKRIAGLRSGRGRAESEALVRSRRVLHYASTSHVESHADAAFQFRRTNRSFWRI